MATSLDLARTYTSYSGVDIKVVINGAQVGSMQALSYAIQREKAPIYVMGSVDPISYSRGKRGIAGTMISLMMDTHLLMSPSFTGEYYLGDTDEIFPVVGKTDANAATPRYSGGAANTTGANAEGNTSILGNLQNEVNEAVSLLSLDGRRPGATLESFKGVPGEAGATGSGAYERMENNIAYNLENIGQNYKVSPVFYVDQVLPFDIAIVAANEYGQTAQMRLYGCEILNEGSGFSIDDIVIENQMTYVCRTILPWRTTRLKVESVDDGKGNKTLVDARTMLYDRLKTADNRGGRPGGVNKDLAYAKYAEQAAQSTSTQPSGQGNTQGNTP